MDNREFEESSLKLSGHYEKKVFYIRMPGKSQSYGSRTGWLWPTKALRRTSYFGAFLDGTEATVNDMWGPGVLSTPNIPSNDISPSR